MDSPETKTDNFELPKPTGMAQETGASSAEHGVAPEQQTTPSSSNPAGASFTTAQPSVGNPAAVQGAAAPLSSSLSAHSAGLSADDVDLIEKTWVEKAKQIVAETRGDPYAQNKEINKVKADYIKKRYNKDIKLASD